MYPLVYLNNVYRYVLYKQVQKHKPPAASDVEMAFYLFC